MPHTQRNASEYSEDEMIEVPVMSDFLDRDESSINTSLIKMISEMNSIDNYDGNYDGNNDGIDNNGKEYSSLLNDFNPDDEQMKDDQEEILNPKLYRYTIKPIDPKYQILWDLYKKQHQSHWTPEEVDFADDKHDFNKLDANVQHFIKMVLAFFAGADTIVNINIKENFSKITIKEAEVAYGFQQMMENIHGEVYAEMLINIIEDQKERDDLINAFKNVESIKNMINWATAWTNGKRRIAFSIMAFTIFEGLMFSGAFASIYWLKKTVGEGKMKGLVQSNNLIAKDEGMHTNFGCIIYDFVINKLTNDEAKTMMNEAVEIAKQFTKDAIRVDLIGMNPRLMNNYLEYVADRLMVYLGYEKIYGTVIPESFEFMESIGFLNKDNFFERRPTEYQLSYNSQNKGDWQFKILNDF